MNCREIQTLIHGYVDGELDLTKSPEIEQHLQECPECARDYANLQSIRAAIKDSDLYSRTPPGLAKRVRSAMHRASHLDRTSRLRPGRLITVAASLALITAAGWGLAVLLARGLSEAA